MDLDQSEGTMSVWFNTAEDGTVRHILANSATTNGLFNVFIDQDNKVKVNIRKSTGSISSLLTTNELIQKDTWNFASVTWETINGVLDTTLSLNGVNYTASTSDFQDFSNGTTALGASITGGDPLNGYLEQFTYSDARLSDLAIQTIYEEGRVNNVHDRYDQLGRLFARTIDTGNAQVETTLTYMAGLNGSSTSKVETMNNNGNVISYAYDANGNVQTITQNDMTITYYYNELNELNREDNPLVNKTIVYEYDVGGNLLTKKEYPYTTVATSSLGTETNTISYTYGDPNWKDTLSNYNGKTITYDAIGNPTGFDGNTYTWEFGDRLAGITGNGIDLSFKYNDSGIRTEKTINGVTTTYRLNGNLVTYETDGTDEIYYTYDANNKLISMNINGDEYFYIRNIQGDIIGLFDETGIQVVSYEYDTWGQIVSITGTLADTIGKKNPYRYRGYRYDSETGLYYLQTRYYNPEWGRFLNADSYGEVREKSFRIMCMLTP